MAEDFRSAVIGSLVGVAVGDCLGVGVEGFSPDRIAAQFGLIDDFRYDPAVWSDDTQQTLVLVESTVRNGFPDPDWVGRRFVQMRDALASEHFGVHRGTGRGFRSAVDRFAETGDWRSSARTDRVGNGPAMRIAPIGVALRDLDDESFRRAIAEVSILTHREIRSIAAALAVAKTAAELSRSPSYPPDNDPLRRLLQVLDDSLRETEVALASMYEDLFVRRKR